MKCLENSALMPLLVSLRCFYFNFTSDHLQSGRHVATPLLPLRVLMDARRGRASLQPRHPGLRCRKQPMEGLHPPRLGAPRTSGCYNNGYRPQRLWI